MAVFNLTAVQGAMGASAALILAASASGAAAQSDDWDQLIQPSDRLTAAYIQFSNGLTLLSRCQHRTFQVLIHGLPEAPPARTLAGAQRTLKIAFGDDDPSPRRFMVGQDRRSAFAEVPGLMARKLRQGGPMRIVVEDAGPEGQNLIYALDLPASGSAIDRTLEACGRPLIDPHDAQIETLGEDGLPIEVKWARPPRIFYPEGQTFTAGYATIICGALPDGALADCLVETEFPVEGGFGAAALRAARHGRVTNTNGGPVPPGRIVFRANFSMSDVPKSRDRDNSDKD